MLYLVHSLVSITFVPIQSPISDKIMATAFKLVTIEFKKLFQSACYAIDFLNNTLCLYNSSCRQTGVIDSKRYSKNEESLIVSSLFYHCRPGQVNYSLFYVEKYLEKKTPKFKVFPESFINKTNHKPLILHPPYSIFT